MKLRTILLVVLALTSAGFLDCGKKSTQPQVVLVLMKTLDNPFFQDIRSGIESKWAKGGPTLLVRAGTKEGDVTSQRQILNDAFNQYAKGQNPPSLKGILLTPSASGSELTTQIGQMRDAGIPVILLDTRIEDTALAAATTDYNVFIGSDNREGGARAADVLVNALGKGGTVLLLNGVDGQETAEARKMGFLENLRTLEASKGFSFKVVERTCNWRRDEARNTVAGLLALGHSVDGVFAANDEMALGASIAFEQAKIAPSPPIVGFDAIPEAVAAVNSGRLIATIQQDARGIGEQGAMALQEILAGKVVKKDQIVPVRVIQ